jgi:hypothetical protein
MMKEKFARILAGEHDVKLLELSGSAHSRRLPNRRRLVLPVIEKMVLT